jgi:ketosteroid isomerase-like protein
VHPSDSRSIAARCLASWTSGDLDGLRELLADDVTFDGPLGHTEGADDYVSGVARMARMVTAAEQQQLIADGDEVVILYELITHDPPARIPTAGVYRIRDGKVASVRAFFDPRPLTEAAPAPPS